MSAPSSAAGPLCGPRLRVPAARRRSYVVDSADPDNIAVSKTELHDLLAKPALERIPVRRPAAPPPRRPAAVAQPPCRG